MNTQQPTNIDQVAQTREALPSSMRYALGNADAIPSSTTERMFSANNGNSFSPTGSNEIRIPVQASEGFLDTAKHYLFFTIQNGSAAAKFLDGDISAIIEQVRITSQGVELERLDDYALLHNYKKLYNQSYTEREMRNAKSGGPSFVATPAGADFANLTINLENSVVGAQITNAESANFCVQLDSGFLMGHHKKALPMGMAEFEIVIRLNSGSTALVSVADAANIYTITNPRFYCPVYKIEDMNVLNQYKMLASQRGISWSGDTNKLYMGSLGNNGAATQTIQINDRSLSLKSLITMIRPAASVGTQALTLSSSCITGVSQYHYKIGGMNYPQVPIDVVDATNGINICRLYDQAVKSFANPGFSHSESLVSQARVIKAYPALADLTAGIDSPNAVVAVDLRRFDDERLSYVGLNTAKNASPNTLEIVGDAGLNYNATTNTYAICEAEYTMQSNGSLRVQV